MEGNEAVFRTRQDDEKYWRVRSRSVLICLAVFMMLSFLGQLLLQILLAFAAHRGLFDAASFLEEHAMLASSIPMYAFAFPLTLILKARLLRKESVFDEIGSKHQDRGEAGSGRVRIGTVRFLLLFCEAYFLMMIGNLLGSWLMMLFSYEGENVVSEAIMRTNGAELLLSTVVLAPLVEEYLLRRFLLDALRGLNGSVLILLSAFCFALMHGNFFQFFYAFFLGAMFAAVYLRTGKLRDTVALHMLINFCGGFLPQQLMQLGTQGNMRFYTAVSAGISVLLFIVLLIGAVMFLRTAWCFVRRRIKRRALGTGKCSVTAGCSLRIAFCNFGMLLFLTVCIALFALNY